MKEILLTQGRVTLVDDSDYEYLNQWKWCVSNGYVARRLKKHEQVAGASIIAYMHRVIMLPPDGMHVDHHNGQKTDNQRSNLRVCTRTQNNRNIRAKPGYSEFKGAYWNRRASVWFAEITVNYEKKYLGCYRNEEDAARAYDAAAIKYFGEFARLNFPIQEVS